MRRSTPGGSESFFYHLDARGDILSLTDMQGHEVASYAYGPWGELQYARGPEAQGNPLRYASYCYDPESGLYYLINRYYDPVTGRFISRDPARQPQTDPLGRNPYLYCGDEPVGRVDPEGLKAWKTDNDRFPWKNNSAWMHRQYNRYARNWLTSHYNLAPRPAYACSELAVRIIVDFACKARRRLILVNCKSQQLTLHSPLLRQLAA